MKDLSDKDEYFTEEQKKKIIFDMIIHGYGTFEVNRYGKTWTFKTLLDKEKLICHDMASVEEDEDVKWQMYMIYILKKSLVALNGVPLDEDTAEIIGSKLSRKIIMELFDEYQHLDRLSHEYLDNTDYIKMVKDDSYSRMKFQVMKAFNALPTEDRVKNMNDHQWFWCYFNLIEDEKDENEKIKQRLDYLSYYINPELAVKIHEQEKNQTNGVYVQKEHDEVDVNNPNKIIHYGEGVIDLDFDMKLKQAMGDAKITELPSDTEKGNKYETESDFIKRVQLFEEQQKKYNEALENDAKMSGRSANEFDIIDFDEEDE